MFKIKGTLDIPSKDLVRGAREALRVWERPGQDQVVILNPAAFVRDGRVDAGAWGLMLVDIARHVASAYQQAFGADPEEVANRIKEMFDAEWDAPTDQPRGEIVSSS